MPNPPTPENIVDTQQEPERVGLLNSRSMKPSFLIAAGAVFAIAAITRDESLVSVGDFRNILPEPFDIPDHIANTMWTITGASPVAIGVSSVLRKSENTVSYGKTGGTLEFATETEYKKRRNIFIGATALISLGLNTFGEAVASSGFDTTDFAYGLIGGAIVYAAQKSSFISPDYAESVVDNMPKDHPLRKVFTKFQPIEEKQPIQPSKKARNRSKKRR